MYCPNCKKEFEDSYGVVVLHEGDNCPDCGTKLIEKPATGGLTVDGSGNAIDMHKTEHNTINDHRVSHDSHNDMSQHYDQRGMIQAGTYYAAQTTEQDVTLKKEERYRVACRRVYEDLVIDDVEIKQLKGLAQDLGLSDDRALSILNGVKQQMDAERAREEALTPRAQKRLQRLLNSMRENDVESVVEQLESFDDMVTEKNISELHFVYYLAQAALNHSKCIALSEKSITDSYWRSYWSYVAYIKNGNKKEATRILDRIETKFSDYSVDNTALLEAVGELMLGNRKAAEKAFFLDVNESKLSPRLQRLFETLLLILAPVKAEEMGANANTCAFYLVNFFEQKDFNKEIERLSECCIWEDVKDFSEGLAAVFDGEYWGFINSRMKLVIPCEYDTVRSFNEGVCAVQKEGYYGFIDSKGKCLTDFEYDDVSAFHEGLCGVEQDGKWGFIDRKGKLVIPCEYRDVSIFSEGLAGALRVRRWGFIDKSGNFTIKPIYDHELEFLWFSEGLKSVCYHGKYGFIDHKGNEIIEFQYEEAFDFVEGLALVKKGGLYGVINKQGKTVVPFKYDFDNINEFSEGMARIKSNGLYGYINSYGKEVIPCKYEDADDFKDGYACVGVNGYYGFINKKGNVVIPLKYNMAYSFSEGLALVEIDDHYGFIDMNGDEVIPCKYDRAQSFHEKMARIGMDTDEGTKWGFIPAPALSVAAPVEDKEEIVVETEPFSWTFSDGVLEIKGSGTMEDYEEESKVPWGKYIDAIERVIINKGITSIGDNAFNGCENLNDISIPEGIVKIGESAFLYCTSLPSAVFPASLRSIEDTAFYGCESLESLIIPGNVRRIGVSAFNYCDSLKDVILSNGIEIIDSYAFECCERLSQVALPRTVTELGADVFPNECQVIKK